MAKTKHGVVRLDDVRAVYNGKIYSVAYDADILENGMIGVVGDLVEGEREIRKFVKPSGTTEPVAIVAHSEINYNEDRISNNALENFFIPAGQPARAYNLERADIVSVSKDMVTPLETSIEIGAKVTTAADSMLMTEVASPTGDEAFLGKVIDKEKIGTATVVGQAGAISRVVEFIVVEVEKNRA